MNIWRKIIHPGLEKDGELATFLNDSLENSIAYIDAYDDPRVPSQAKREYTKRLRVHIGHLMEYLETGNIRDCPRRKY